MFGLPVFNMRLSETSENPEDPGVQISWYRVPRTTTSVVVGTLEVMP